MAKATRKQQILEAATKAAAEQGLRALSAGSIAKKLKVQPSLVFYYFPTVKDLFDQLIGSVVEANLAFVMPRMEAAKGSSHRKILQEFVEGNLEWAERKPSHVALLLHGLADGEHDEHIAETVGNALEAGIERIYQQLAIGVAEKEFTVHLPLQEAATLVHQAMIGAIVHQFLFRKSTPRKKFAERMSVVIQEILT